MSPSADVGTNSPRPVHANNEASGPKPPDRVLILTFEETDSKSVQPVADDVEKAFNGKGYDTKAFKIPTQNPWDALQPVLDDFFLKEQDSTRILYYLGHGGYSSRSGTLKLVNQVKGPKAVIRWSDVCTKIKPASHDVLMVLHCCKSGAASVDLEKMRDGMRPGGKDYFRELLSPVDWNDTTTSRFGRAFCHVLDTLPDGGMSLPSVCREIDKYYVNECNAKEKKLKEIVARHEKYRGRVEFIQSLQKSLKDEVVKLKAEREAAEQDESREQRKKDELQAKTASRKNDQWKIDIEMGLQDDEIEWRKNRKDMLDKRIASREARDKEYVGKLEEQKKKLDEVASEVDKRKKVFEEAKSTGRQVIHRPFHRSEHNRKSKRMIRIKDQSPKKQP